MTAFIIYLMRIRYLLSFITAVIALVLGIIVTVNKLKQTKILGFSVIFTAVSGIISSLYLYLVNYRGIWEVANLNKLHTVLVLAFSLAGLYFICLYVHRNYHYKFIYFPVLIVPVVERIANLISNRLVFTLSSPYTEYYVLTSRVQIAQNITSLVVSTVIFFILFIVFYLNKKNEKFIPHYYVICLITLIWRVINHGFTALYHMIISLDATAWFDANTVADFAEAANIILTAGAAPTVTADTVTNNVNGFTTVLDEEIYKNKIKEILNNKKLLNKVSKNARQMLGKNWQDIAYQTHKLYLEEIIKKQNK